MRDERVEPYGDRTTVVANDREIVQILPRIFGEERRRYNFIDPLFSINSLFKSCVREMRLS